MLPAYFNYKGYLELAKQLLLTSSTSGALTEASLRSSISRSYYCAFLYARQFHSNRGVGHGELIAWVKSHDFVLADDLADLKAFREDCDYDHPITYSLGSKAQECVDIVEELLGRLDELFGK